MGRCQGTFGPGKQYVLAVIIIPPGCSDYVRPTVGLCQHHCS